MKKRIMLSIVTLVVLAIVFLAGIAVGNRRTFDFMMEFQRAEVNANLNFTVETLALIRTGDQSGAIELMENRLDIGLVTLAQKQPWEDLPESTRKTLILLKTYRKIYPPKQQSAVLQEALNLIPSSHEPPEYCSPPLQKALEVSEGNHEASNSEKSVEAEETTQP
ncbi:hypothetical protein JW926_10985 [Candidatus Sumerlaeota bacterium]|nr:hypothetical protein [Candidatus Sumerlaeota bacterium]